MIILSLQTKLLISIEKEAGNENEIKNYTIDLDEKNINRDSNKDIVDYNLYNNNEFE